MLAKGFQSNLDLYVKTAFYFNLKFEGTEGKIEDSCQALTYVKRDLKLDLNYVCK